MTRAFVGLGSNLEGPLAQVRKALAALMSLPDTTVERVSSFYGNPAVGPGVQPDYVNAVAELHTELEPMALLRQLQAIENDQGRIRLERWGPRTLDLDLLLYGDRSIDEAELEVPHPRLTERDFVLVPLAEIAPELKLPDGRAVAELAQAFTSTLSRIAVGGETS